MNILPIMSDRDTILLKYLCCKYVVLCLLVFSFFLIPGHALAQSWERITPDKAYVNCLAIHPTNPDIMITGTPGGLYKSTDGAENWKKVDKFPHLPVSCLKWNPIHTNTLYAGTKEGGIFKSIDTGDNWTAIGLDSLKEICAIEILPNNPQTLFAGGYVKIFDGYFMEFPSYDAKSHGIYCSNDGGNSWSLTEAPGDAELDALNCILSDPENDSIIYAGFEAGFGSDKVMLISKDCGETWGWSAEANGWESVLALSATPKGYKNPAIYALRGDFFDWQPCKLYKSNNHGKSWEYIQEFKELGSLLMVNPNFPDYVFLGAPSDSTSLIIYDAEKKDFMYNSSNPAGAPTSIAFRSDAEDAFQFFVTFSDDDKYPSPLKGIYKYTQPDENNWQPKVKGFWNTAISDIVFYGENNSSSLLISKDENRIIQYTMKEGSSHYLESQPTRFELSTVTIDPNNPEFIIAAPSVSLPTTTTIYLDPINAPWNTMEIPTPSSFYVYISRDGGTTWESIYVKTETNNSSNIRYGMNGSRFMFCQNNSNEILLSVGSSGGFGDIYKSYNKGMSWERKTWLNGNNLVSDPQNSDIIYSFQDSPGYVRKSQDFGETWEFVSPYEVSDEGLVRSWSRYPDGNEWAWHIDHLVVDNHAQVFIIADGSLKKWIKDTTWVDMGVPPTGIIHDMTINLRIEPAQIFLAAEGGIFYTQDEGQSWIPYESELDYLPVTTLKFTNSSPNYLYAGVRYGGVWVKEMHTTPVLQLASNNNISIFPNPNNGTFYIDTENGNEKINSLCIYDLLGRKVYEAQNHFPSPSNPIQIKLNSVTTGIYFMNINVNGQWHQLKLVVSPY